MKTGILFSGATLLIILFYSFGSYAENTILLKDAQTSKQINLVIHGVSNEVDKVFSGTHVGECIEFEIKNLTNSALEIKIEAGRKLICLYDSIQNMMITKEMIFAVKSNETLKRKAFAMCIEQHDHSPNSKSLFKLGEMAEGHLLELARTLDQYNYQDNCGQSAVWTIVEDKDTSNIWSIDPEQKKFMRKYVSALRADNVLMKDNSSQNIIYKETPEYYISGNLEWNLLKKYTASLIVYDEQGNFVTNIFKDRKFDSGEQKYSFKMVSCLLKPDTKYLVRLKVNDITQEELIVMTE